ncbi:TPA: fimbrial protein [Serratia marcescens]
MKVLGTFFFIYFSIVIMGVKAAENMSFKGTLRDDIPCVIPPGEENVDLDFGSVVDRYLYANQRTPGKMFEIHLEECDLSLAKTVSLTFSGQVSQELPGFLALSPASQVTGVAIGVETPAGEKIMLNKSTSKYDLLAGGNILRLQAYVQGEPQALAGKNIGYGVFSAVMTFSLEYE